MKAGLVLAALTAVSLLGPPSLRGQEGFRPPRPEITLTRGGAGGAELRLGIPDGWVLYAPDPGGVGLPLEVAWSAAGRPVELPLVWPTAQVYGDPTARVFRGSVVARTLQDAALPAGAPLRARVRWALCRDDLCVPGLTEVEAAEPR